MIQSDICFPASRLQQISNNILAKLVEVFLLIFQTRFKAGVSTKTYLAHKGKFFTKMELEPKKTGQSIECHVFDSSSNPEAEQDIERELAKEAQQVYWLKIHLHRVLLATPQNDFQWGDAKQGLNLPDWQTDAVRRLVELTNNDPVIRIVLTRLAMASYNPNRR